MSSDIINKSKEDCTEDKLDNGKLKMRKEKVYQTKVVIRRLPPTMTEEQFMDQISPIPENDYLQFVKADMSLGQHAFSRGYINFLNPNDIFIFKDKFDGYMFLDNKGNEFPAVVEFAPFQKIPKRKNKKRDAKCGTIDQDPDYIKFLETVQNPEQVILPSAENYLEMIESRERELKANNGIPKITTPLIEYLKQRKLEQQKIREEKREERKRREMEKRRLREEERRRRKAEKDKEKDKCKEKKEGSLEKETFKEPEKSSKVDETKDSETVIVKVLRNPERERERDKDIQGYGHLSQKHKDTSTSSIMTKPSRDRDRGRKEWERQRERERERQRLRERERPRTSSIRDKLRKDKDDYRSCTSESGHKSENIQEKNNLSHIGLSDHGKFSNRDRMERMSERRSSFDEDRYNVSECNEKKKSYTNSRDFDVGTVGDDDFNDSKDTRRSTDDSKDPRVERRIRNKDRPSLEIYRPGMRRLNTQRNTSQKEVSTSASNSSTPSPSPTPSSQSIISSTKKVSSEWSRTRSQPSENKVTASGIQDINKKKEKGKEVNSNVAELDKTDEET
ncbi:regulator of nonsense transcripts 3A-like isoform X2 [Centruroides sculpturatus]|uniref:regulator of nonsense transcripts 3A-like isoform X2 n=1 Tax=Centruroides sculpturatus TaxID=218467 RepID=UPI000C6CAD5A|nr:regulator of nonsense transcripts 3A-like isoform X2 [Centruroides sculpturatus]